MLELQARGLNVERDVPIELVYLGSRVGFYRIDLLISGKALVEVKSSSSIGESDKRQLFNYLRAIRKEVGLLLHFGPKPVPKRFVWTGGQFNSES